jgi:hypothetical protein
MGETQPEHSTDDTGPETDQGQGGHAPGSGTTSDDRSAQDERERMHSDDAVPGEEPSDDPEESGEDRFDAG